jgi:hypothetical protein
MKNENSRRVSDVLGGGEDVERLVGKSGEIASELQCMRRPPGPELVGRTTAPIHRGRFSFPFYRDHVSSPCFIRS